MEDPSQSVEIRRETVNQRRTSNIVNVSSKNSNVNQAHFEQKFKIRNDANDLVEVIFADACLKVYKKDDKTKDQEIENLKMELENLNKVLEEEKEKAKKEKLKGYTQVIKKSIENSQAEKIK